MSASRTKAITPASMPTVPADTRATLAALRTPVSRSNNANPRVAPNAATTTSPIHGQGLIIAVRRPLPAMTARTCQASRLPPIVIAITGT